MVDNKTQKVKKKRSKSSKLVSFKKIDHWDSNEPFNHKILSNAFKPKFARKVRRKLLKYYNDSKIDFSLKSSDLFSFYQSKDLVSYINKGYRIIDKVYKIFTKSSFISKFSKLVGYDLAPSIDIFASAYTNTNYLLCHDDRLESRSIAFIYYLTPENWSSSDGGNLQLFNSSGFKPTSLNTQIPPNFNSLAFFEVSDKSFHQVQEVTSNKIRLSLTGWFHRKNGIPRLLTSHFTISINEFKARSRLFSRLINPIYFQQNTLLAIADHLKANKSVQLNNFLSLNLICSIKNEFLTFEWLKTRNPLLHSFSHLNQKKTKKSQIIRFLSSMEFLRFISFLSGKSLKSSEHSLRKFNKGDYTLLYDDVLNNKKIDVVYHLLTSKNKNVLEIDESNGGSIYYLENSKQILTIEPSDNCLSIVCVGKMRSFVKFLNNRCNDDLNVFECKATFD